MIIEHLEITHVRNLQPLKIRPHRNINLFVGPNGSGKTSLLEGISLLGTGRSFRTEQVREVISNGSEELLVFGKITSEVMSHRVGVRRSRNGRGETRVDGVKAVAASELAKVLPLITVRPETMELLSGAPDGRRAFLDWVMFHVKHEYQTHWRSYYRALKQRNAALRENRTIQEIRSWDEGLVVAGQNIDKMRRAVFGDLYQAFSQEMATVDVGEALTVELMAGVEDDGLESALDASFKRDVALGYTTVGPHRADIRVIAGGRPAKKVLSRGQSKLAIWGLVYAAIETKRMATGSGCVILIDDLGSELDALNRRWVLSRLGATNDQVFITATDALDLPSSTDQRMFHVKHGDLQEVV